MMETGWQMSMDRRSGDVVTHSRWEEVEMTGNLGDVAKNKLILQILYRRRIRPDRSIRRSRPNSNLR
jgi:hypothetical protein